MKTLYIDCSNGVSGDMLLAALEKISGTNKSAAIEIDCYDHNHGHESLQDHGETYHGRSYATVKKIIENSRGPGVTPNAKAYAAEIYAVIAEAEAMVHGETLETMHFHEVGRDRAILNALGIGRALDSMGFRADGGDADETAGRIFVSDVFDGSGFVECAHGRIAVPVPAVRAMMDRCAEKSGPGYGFKFRTAEDVDTEILTPSGLAALMGIKAEPAPKGCSIMGKITAEAEGKGTRDTGRSGLRIFLAEV